MTSANDSEGARGMALFQRPLECIESWWECIVFGGNKHNKHSDQMKQFLIAKKAAMMIAMLEKPYMRRWPVQKTTDADTKAKLASQDAVIDIANHLSSFCEAIVPDRAISDHMKNMGVFCLKLQGLHEMLCAKIRHHKKGTHSALAKSVVLHLTLRELMTKGWQINLNGIRSHLTSDQEQMIWVKLHELLDSANADEWELPVKMLQDKFIHLLMYAHNEEEKEAPRPKRMRLRDGEISMLVDKTVTRLGRDNPESLRYLPVQMPQPQMRPRQLLDRPREMENRFYSLPQPPPQPQPQPRVLPTISPRKIPRMDVMPPPPPSPPLEQNPFQPSAQMTPLQMTSYAQPVQAYDVHLAQIFGHGTFGNWSARTSEATSGVPSLQPPSTPSSVTTNGSHMFSPEPSVHIARQHRHDVLPAIPYSQPSGPVDGYSQFGGGMDYSQVMMNPIRMESQYIQRQPSGMDLDYFPYQMMHQIAEDRDIEMNHA